jgi:hypothetical protein
MDYVTIAGVELGSVGMRWHAGTGDVTFTFEHLADVMRAANDDPHIQPPRVKIGHYSKVNGDAPDFDPFTALGDVINLQLTNDGATLVGDLIEVPDWLGFAAPSAYPARSGEWIWDVETPGGKRYSCVMTALALLGVALPAVQDLDDLTRLMVDGPQIAPTATGRARDAGRPLTTRRHHAAARGRQR